MSEGATTSKPGKRCTRQSQAEGEGGAIGGKNSENVKESFEEFRKRMRKNKMAKPELNHVIPDIYESSIASKFMVRGKTGIVYDDFMAMHKCEWDENYPENPNRYLSIMKRFKELNLLDACTRIDFKACSLDELKAEDIELAVLLNKLCNTYDIEKAENVASGFDSIYFNKHTYKCATLAAGATIALTRAIANNSVQNGMAIVRPPGHHAHIDFNGYCFFNNVGLAARELLQSGYKKVLIVDFDVHHGQGTQRMFYDNNEVLYFSIHRYEHGLFWPNLRESNFHYIGKGIGTGYNINFPLNAIGLTDADYMAIVTNILLPVAYEFQPDFIVFSAGFDACVGCPEGEMNISPGFYGHLVKLLSGLARGKIAVILEGGYFLPSLAEGAAMVLQALLDYKPAFLDPMGRINPAVISTINDLRFVLQNNWKCFKLYIYNTPDLLQEECHRVQSKFLDKCTRVPPFETRNCYPVRSPESEQLFTEIVAKYQREYGPPTINAVCYGYDPEMLLHTTKEAVVEHPKRLEAVYQRFMELGLNTRCQRIAPNIKDNSSFINLIHNKKYVKGILNGTHKSLLECSDMYWCKDGSETAITKAVSTILAVADAVTSGKFSSGVALIRPPGHHAEANKCSGFCFINNVAVTAQYLIDSYHLKRILIVDFDIHHGNGTQKMFYETDKVLFISVHKYDDGKFYPSGSHGSSSKTGEGKGAGYNINIPFSGEKMDDADYLATFFRVILPVAYSFAPEIILISAGFDAGINDPLGNYNVLPEAFGHMVQLLRPLSRGKIILCMEGGYNLNTLKHSMAFCVKTLLGDPLPSLNTNKTIKKSTFATLNQVVKIQKQYWPILSVDKRLPGITEASGDEPDVSVRQLTKLLNSSPIV